MGENYLNFHDTVLLVSSIECFILALVVKMTPGRIPQVRNLLALFFIVMAIALSSNMALWKVELSANLAGSVSFVLMLMISASLMKGPLLYLYVRSVYKKKVDARDGYLYVIPLLLVILAMVVCGIGIYDWVGPRELNSLSGYVVFGLWWLIKIVPVVFVINIFLLLKNGNASSASDDIEYAGELAFSKVVFYCFGAHWFLLLLAYVSGFFMSQQTNVALGVAGNYFMFILLKVIFVVGVIAVLQAVKVVKKNERNKISDHLAKIEKIEDAILTKKMHLDKTINLERFSQRIDLNAREVSLLIHAHHKCNFVDFINQNRVEEAKINLCDAACSKESIKSIALRSGFNSISSFNRIFAKHTQMTPSEYRSKNSTTDNE